MRQCLSKTKSCLIALVCGICVYGNGLYAAAGSAHIKADGYNQLVTVWHDVDESTGLLKILATYGNKDPSTVSISNPELVHAHDPILATSHSESPFTAVAVWKMWDVTSGGQGLQAAVATASGWNTYSGVTISDLELEVPQGEYKVDMSDDGLVIGICWNSYITLKEDLGIYVVRKVTSTDGGANWSPPVNL